MIHHIQGKPDHNRQQNKNRQNQRKNTKQSGRIMNIFICFFCQNTQNAIKRYKYKKKSADKQSFFRIATNQLRERAGQQTQYNCHAAEYGIYKKYQIAENTLFWIHGSPSRLFTDDHSFSLLFIQESFHIITRSVFYLDVNLSNILSDQSNAYQLNTAKEPDGQNKGCPPFYYMTGAITDQCIAGS